MATRKQLFNQPVRGYWENKKTKNIYLIFEGHFEDDSSKMERMFWNATAINLRTGKVRRFALKDFENLELPDSYLLRILRKNIDVVHFYQSHYSVNR